MAGICAVIGSDSEQIIKKINNALKHRGPDNEGYFFDKNLALGHRALKISDNNFTFQPLSNEDETIWITFDGEIYNKEHLINKLKKNHEIKLNNSAEIVLHAYEDENLNCINKFNGMFAFCLWDSNKDLLFCARDRLGLKPLYYYKDNDMIILASEIKGILGASKFPKKPNKKIIYEYLIGGARASRSYANKTSETFFSGIFELRPAYFLYYKKNRFWLQRYWCPNIQSVTDRRDGKSYVSEFRRKLERAVRLRLPENASFGTFLSGGLDSTSLAAQTNKILEYKMNKRKNQSQIFFSAVYNEKNEQGDERDRIKEVEDILRTEVNYIYPSVKGGWENIKQFIYYIEEPVGVFNYYVYWCLFQAAKKKVKVIFHGQGPDEVFGGHTIHAIEYFKDLWEKKRIWKLTKEMLSCFDWVGPYWWRSLWFKKNARKRAEELTSLKPLDVSIENTGINEGSRLKKILLRDTEELLVEHLRVEDRGSSAFSLECRHPYLDHNVVEYVFSLPDDAIIGDGLNKLVLRKAMKGLIPEHIRLGRKKAATPIPFQNWLKTLQPNIRELFNSKKIQEQGYFNTDTILKIIDLYCDGKLSTVERLYYAGTLWRCINLALWLDIFSFNE